MSQHSPPWFISAHSCCTSHVTTFSVCSLRFSSCIFSATSFDQRSSIASPYLGSARHSSESRSSRSRVSHLATCSANEAPCASQSTRIAYRIRCTNSYLRIGAITCFISREMSSSASPSCLSSSGLTVSSYSALSSSYSSRYCCLSASCASSVFMNEIQKAFWASSSLVMPPLPMMRSPVASERPPNRPPPCAKRPAGTTRERVARQFPTRSPGRFPGFAMLMGCFFPWPC